MSKFLNDKFKNITPYSTSDEINYNVIRLNTNESPYKPSKLIYERINNAIDNLNFYSDPDCSELGEKLSSMLDINKSQILFGNGSDEILNFIFTVMCQNGAAFPDITYSFYKVLAEIHEVNYKLIPLQNFKIVPENYFNLNRTIFITNPNAPTGLALNLNEIEKILIHNPNNLIVIDEAYIDFGAESAIKLIEKFENILIVRTFSKSRSLAGARLGFCVGNENLINDLRNIKNSIAPYNINAMTQIAGLAVLDDEEYTQKNLSEICSTREKVYNELNNLGFYVLDSKTNFLFARHENFTGQEICNILMRNNIAVRHFTKPEKISNFVRITIGTPEQMNLMLEVLKNALR